MSMAINRDAIQQVVMRGQSAPAGMIAPPFVNGWNEAMDSSSTTDIEGAKALGNDDPEMAEIVLKNLRAEGIEIAEEYERDVTIPSPGCSSRQDIGVSTVPMACCAEQNRY